MGLLSSCNKDLLLDEKVQNYISEGKDDLRGLNYSRALSYINDPETSKDKFSDYYTFGFSAKSRSDNSITQENLALIASKFPNIINLRIITPKGIPNDLDFTVFENVRMFRSNTGLPQNHLNSILKLKNLMMIKLVPISYNSGDPIDSIPSYIGELKKLQYVSISGNYGTHFIDRVIKGGWGDPTNSPYDPGNPYMVSNIDMDTLGYKGTRDGDVVPTVPDFPESFGDLPLKYLQLTGFASNKLPECIGDLDELEELVIDGHNLNDGLEYLGKNNTSLKKLKLHLGVSEGNLSENFGHMTSLEELDMECFNCTSLPENFGNLKNLKSLKMKNFFHLRRLPESFGNLTSLVSLNVDNCHKMNYWPSFSGMPNLKTLRVDEGGMTTFPEISKNSSLECVQVTKCPLNNIHPSIGNAKSLRFLSLTGGLLMGIPKEIGQCDELVTIQLDSEAGLRFHDTVYYRATPIKRYKYALGYHFRYPKEMGNMDNLTFILGPVPSREDYYNITKLMSQNSDRTEGKLITDLIVYKRSNASPLQYKYESDIRDKNFPPDYVELNKRHVAYADSINACKFCETRQSGQAQGLSGSKRWANCFE